MADYIRQISASSQMMIRDTGGNVEFWFRTGPTTWNNDQQWSYHANGGSSPTLKHRLVAGGGWQHFGSAYVPYDQDVRFSIYGSGIGFPSHDFFQHITRSTVPAAPYIWYTEAISSTHIHVAFNDGHNGGSAIVERVIAYGTNPNGAEALVGSDGSTDLGPFPSGQRQYFWARTRNSIGWSNWSNRTDKEPWRIPDSPYRVSFHEISQTSVKTAFADRSDGGQPFLERQVGYSLTGDTPTEFAVANPDGVTVVSNLEPGKLYYFWFRSRNSIGWSFWSERSQVTLIAGARIYDEGQWKRAVPYVKVSGVWKVVRPWVRIGGTWKETSL